MPTTTSYALTICPFFESESRTDIRCEGVIEKTLLVTRFTTPEAKTEYQRNICCTWGYKTCPIAELIHNEKYYAEEDND